jgi:hypothetical protein
LHVRGPRLCGRAPIAYALPRNVVRHPVGRFCRCNGQYALLAADLIHHPLQLRRPDISAAMCVDPTTSVTSRRDILHRYANRDTWFLASHLSRGGYLRHHGQGYTLTHHCGQLGDCREDRCNS